MKSSSGINRISAKQSCIRLMYLMLCDRDAHITVTMPTVHRQAASLFSTFHLVSLFNILNGIGAVNAIIYSSVFQTRGRKVKTRHWPSSTVVSFSHGGISLLNRCINVFLLGT